MPIYEYRCGDCDHEYDQLRSMRTMDEVRACPKCGSMATERRLPSRFAVPTGAIRDDRGAYDPGVAAEYARIQQQPDPDQMTTEEWFHDP